MLRFLLLCSAAAAVPVVFPPLYSRDPSWKPAFPLGSHTFSGVAVAPPLGPSGSSVLYVTQRGNRTVDPVLVLASVLAPPSKTSRFTRGLLPPPHTNLVTSTPSTGREHGSLAPYLGVGLGWPRRKQRSCKRYVGVAQHKRADFWRLRGV